ncbi:hypothetical protein [Demequina oxidasica]|uniref:hypothetical protein n=1 Tax=Demequina oxidasica TaxID=676199 RepID=UPI0007807B6D|nr:hypothetical protein [Demequina oxidasica]
MTELATERFTVVVDLERGAKITSLLDHTGREWLAQAAPGASRRAGAAFTDAEMAGWDECAPTIDASVVDGVSMPDHGDLWDQAFTGDAAHSAITRAELGFTFERSITEVREGIRLHYRVTALRERIPFLWAAHPQFSAPAGTRVLVAAQRIVDVIDPEEPMTPINDSQLQIDTVDPGKFRKWYADPHEPVTVASLIRADGGVLDMEWSSNCPYVGVWFDNCAFSREPVIAIEPSNGFRDSLALAIQRDRVTYVEPGEPLEWWVELRLR